MRGRMSDVFTTIILYIYAYERRFTMSPKAKEKETGRLRIVSLGGVDEIGKNMYVFEYEDDIIVVDCGSVFPKEDMLGVDLVIPDIT